MSTSLYYSNVKLIKMLMIIKLVKMKTMMIKPVNGQDDEDDEEPALSKLPPQVLLGILLRRQT